MLKKIAITSAMLCVALGAIAQDVKLYRSTDKLNAEEVAQILRPKMKMRGMTETQLIAEQGPSALALPVQFSFDSATILPEAMGQLDVVAEGIKLLDGASSIVIEGHTDRHGKEMYNRTLSQRRADAVKVYLVQKHGIDETLFKTEGKGFNELYNSRNPFSGENRRVQFRAGA